MTKMTTGERNALTGLLRRREKVTKSAVAQRSKELEADFEDQLAREFSFDDDAVWTKAYAMAERVITDAVHEAKEVVAARSEELGIPARFAPELHGGLAWRNRGENVVNERRVELRRVAQSRIKAVEAEAKTKIEAASVEIETKLVASGLESTEAQAFLESLPTPEQLMPPLAFTEIQRELDGQPLTPQQRRFRTLNRGGL